VVCWHFTKHVSIESIKGSSNSPLGISAFIKAALSVTANVAPQIAPIGLPTEGTQVWARLPRKKSSAAVRGVEESRIETSSRFNGASKVNANVEELR
jgi:hypothetical protein